MKLLTSTVARILFGVPFLMFGVNHFFYAPVMQGMIPSFLPGGILWIYLTGIGLIAAAVSLFIAKLTKEAMIGVSLFLLAAIAFIHIPGLGSPDQAVMERSMMGMLKDIGLLGASLSFYGQFSGPKA